MPRGASELEALARHGTEGARAARTEHFGERLRRGCERVRCSRRGWPRIGAGECSHRWAAWRSWRVMAHGVLARSARTGGAHRGARMGGRGGAGGSWSTGGSRGWWCAPGCSRGWWCAPGAHAGGAAREGCARGALGVLQGVRGGAARFGARGACAGGAVRGGRACVRCCRGCSRHSRRGGALRRGGGCGGAARVLPRVFVRGGRVCVDSRVWRVCCSVVVREGALAPVLRDCTKS